MLLHSGGALGKGVGPLLISRSPIQDRSKINNMLIAIPGANTTAHMLFSMAFPEARNKQFRVFSTIENAILNSEADAGVIIHENRFTYQQKGLVKIMDLGEYWESQTGLPIPLGAIVLRKSFDKKSAAAINNLIRQSIEFAFANYPAIPEYVRQNSQEMDEEVMRQHINLYVNNYSLDLGQDGLKAVQQFLKIYSSINQLPMNDTIGIQ
jgi:1,4-dihydroxy-6-naphthoate synthase